mmetsp:Transcript_5280/g.18941  ORF Transcript_5280/g.18941 Transcript_5280/m.18941 type:complete len:232 (+) Transcript_5280:441-1136(+)
MSMSTIRRKRGSLVDHWHCQHAFRVDSNANVRQSTVRTFGVPAFAVGEQPHHVVSLPKQNLERTDVDNRLAVPHGATPLNFVREGPRFLLARDEVPRTSPGCTLKIRCRQQQHRHAHSCRQIGPLVLDVVAGHDRDDDRARLHELNVAEHSAVHCHQHVRVPHGRNLSLKRPDVRVILNNDWLTLGCVQVVEIGQSGGVEDGHDVIGVDHPLAPVASSVDDERPQFVPWRQ